VWFQAINSPPSQDSCPNGELIEPLPASAAAAKHCLQTLSEIAALGRPAE
jgi:hypothetical protein